jgi:hypothetical protein
MLEDLPLPLMYNYGVRSPRHKGAGVAIKLGDGEKKWRLGDRPGFKPTWISCLLFDLYLNSLECYCPEAIPTSLRVLGKA